MSEMNGAADKGAHERGGDDEEKEEEEGIKPVSVHAAAIIVLSSRCTRG
jgi:hypothetical protein